jgi:mono/diheme cytochrome c family protein
LIVNTRHYLRLLAMLCVAHLTLVLTACGGGGGSSADATTTPPASTAGSTPPPVPAGPNSFLMFPNPQLQSDGVDQTNSTDYTNAYYQAIDPTNQRTSLAQFESINGFGSGTGTEFTVIFSDTTDLGYGRRLTARRNPDGTLAFVVENYLVGGFGSYGSGAGQAALNLQAAISQDTRWRVEINGIEFSPAPAGTVSFAKFYAFDTTTEARLLQGTLDNRGPKAMPSVCISCHGGRGDALTPPAANGLPLFPLVYNSVSQARGDTQARLQPLAVNLQTFASSGAYTRANQEANLKLLNEWILCSYPLSAPSSAPEDACRRAASGNEWQGDTAATLIKDAYGGPGLPNATYVDTYEPSDWISFGQQTLYKTSVATSCRVCHQLRGTGNQSDLDLSTYTKFSGYTDRVFAHVFDRGNMPLAEIIYAAFWTTEPANPASYMATYLEGQGYSTFSAAGAVLEPGRPIADPGPDRVVTPGATTLTAAMSLYATTYDWTLVSGPAGGATLTGVTGVQPVFTASLAGTYVVQLVVGNGTEQSPPAQQTIVVSSSLSPAPSAIRWVDVKGVLQGATGDCVSCHYPNTASTGVPPIFYTDFDRNGDGVVDATDDLWFYTEVRGRINFTDYIASPLLRKPSGNHHFGGLRPGFDTTAVPGDPARQSYDLIVNWILNGAPYQ